MAVILNNEECIKLRNPCILNQYLQIAPFSDYRLKIWDLSAEDQYVVNLRFSVCFDSHSSCFLDKIIYHEKRLPKNVCDFASVGKTSSMYI